MKQYCYYSSPIGKLLLVGENSTLERLYFQNKIDNAKLGEDFEENARVFKEVIEQLTQYFSGERRSFDLPLAPDGTDFQQRVWCELQQVPYGETTNYGEIAARMGNPRACRAVGLANGRNPIPIIIPCHRIIGKDGSLTGFGGGLKVKKQLLSLEEKYSFSSNPNFS